MNDQNRNQYYSEEFAEHIKSAFNVLKKSYAIIPTLFWENKIYFMDYLHDELADKVIEIRFDSATLTCWFNEDNVCNKSFLFLDDLDNMKYYVDYLNQEFAYDYTLLRWTKGDLSVQVKLEKEDSLFIFRQA